MHESGFVLKPVQAPPKGAREVAFYQTISTSSEETDVMFKDLTAKFFGTESVKMSNGEHCEYLVLGKFKIFLELSSHSNYRVE